MRTTRRYAYPSKDRSTRMQSNEDVVLAVIRAVEERDADALFELFHDDVELRDAPSLPYTNTARGKTAMREQLETAPEETWLGTWGPLQPTEAERRMDPRVVGTRGDEVAVLYTTRTVRAQMFHYDTAGILAFLERAASAEQSATAE
jgi:ketosteroid isomerase-like protein